MIEKKQGFKFTLYVIFYRMHEINLSGGISSEDLRSIITPNSFCSLPQLSNPLALNEGDNSLGVFRRVPCPSDTRGRPALKKPPVSSSC
jgi:hypothetical protein